MFIRKVKNPTGQAYYHIVESYREGKRVRQRTLLSLGRIEDGNLEALVQSAGRHLDILTASQLAKELSTEETFILGPLLILDRLFEDLGINKVIEDIRGSHPRLSFDLKKIIFTLVASRFIHPSSKLKVFEHWQKSFYPEMIDGDLELHHIYRTMDLLCSHKAEIEKSLYWQGRDLFTLEVDIVLYDLTTLRFESTRTDLGNLRQFGYSKERRSDCTQVVFGLLVDRDGIPLGFEVYPGNTFEGKTLSDIVAKMRKKFKVRRFIFVADRGLLSRGNIEKLQEDHGEFIVGMKLGFLAKGKREEVYDLSRFHWVVPDELAVYEVQHEGNRCIVTWSKKRADRDQKARASLLDKIEKKLSANNVQVSSFVSNKGYKKYVKLASDKNQKPELNKKQIEEEAKKDGFFAVLTNVTDMEADSIIMNYKELWKIEDAFGELKGNLKARPVFHWSDHRIIGHLTLCFLAYLCEAHLTKQLREKKVMLKSSAVGKGDHVKPRPLTVVEAMKNLKEVRAIPVKIRDQVIWTRTDIKGNALALFKAARVGIPPKILKTQK